MWDELECLTVVEKDGVVTITIDRPDRRNAIDLVTIQELHRVLEATADDATARVLVITGAGDSVFVSGADVNELRTRRRAEALRGLNNRLFTAIERHPRPVIAAINGAALGGGCELAMACDIRVAVTDALLGFPETGLGIMPAAGGTHRLPRLVGLGKAKELVMTGELLSAEEAYRIGLVNRVVPRGELVDAIDDLARRIMRKAPVALDLAKTSLNLASEMNLASGLEYENVAQAILFESDDKEEGMAAFLDKRKPTFKGR